MGRSWTFGRKVALGFGVSVAMLLVVGTVAYRSTDALIENNRMVNHTHAVLQDIADVLAAMTDAETSERGFVLTGDDRFLEPYQTALGTLGKDVADLRHLTSDNPNQQRRLDDAEPLIEAKMTLLKQRIDLRRTQGFEAAQRAVASGEGRTAMDDLRKVLAAMESEEQQLLEERSERAEASAQGAKTTIQLGALFALVFVIVAGFIITRSLSHQLGTAVSNIRSSSAELQAAANQQAAGAREQSTAMAEIATTIRELLASSRQIADSAQRVAQIATDTATGARSGDQTVARAQDSVGGIRQQVDLIVTHMLELGKKSQQIGNILEIINELAEQTNILAINATIEAAGAGDSGLRFAVVADEIRKLADRVGGSTKDIRSLIEEIRGAVNSTVMATEGGSKAVDTGTRQFADVASAFRQIAELVVTTTDAAREIELSTKQQATAVEQVNVAISNVAQTTKETEASSSQTLQTASQLSGLSRELLLLVQAEGRA